MQVPASFKRRQASFNSSAAARSRTVSRPVPAPTTWFGNGLAYAFNPNVTFTGSGTVEFANGTFNINTDVSAGNVNLSSGSGTVSVGSGKTFAWTGASSWAGGAITGSGVVLNSGTVALTGGSVSGTFQNQATVNWTAGTIGGSGTISNQLGATFNDQTSSNLSIGPTFNNDGAIRSLGHIDHNRGPVHQLGLRECHGRHAVARLLRNVHT